MQWPTVVKVHHVIAFRKSIWIGIVKIALFSTFKVTSQLPIRLTYHTYLTQLRYRPRLPTTSLSKYYLVWISFWSCIKYNRLGFISNLLKVRSKNRYNLVNFRSKSTKRRKCFRIWKLSKTLIWQKMSTCNCFGENCVTHTHICTDPHVRPCGRLTWASNRHV